MYKEIKKGGSEMLVICSSAGKSIIK